MNKKFVGFLSFVPLICYIFVFAGYIQTTLLPSEATLEGTDAVVGILFLLLALVTVVSVYGIMIWFIVNACKNPHFTTVRKALWGVILYSFNIFVFPIYWYQYMYKEWDEEKEAKRPDLSLVWVIVPIIFTILTIPAFIIAIAAPTSEIRAVAIIVAVVTLTVALTFGMFSWILFVVHVCMNKSLLIEKKILWIVFILFFNLIAITIYWTLHLRVKKTEIHKAEPEFITNGMDIN